jgi:hypothetical protein
MNDVSIFEPTVRDMFLDYPELKGYEEFENLTDRELRLCWLVGNRTSPIAKYRDKKKRLTAAVKQVYNKAALERREVKAMLEEGAIPDRIMLGIQRMASFRIGVRLRAKLMDEYIFDQLNDIIFVEETEKLAMDTDEKKKYADLVIKVSSELPDMVRRMEGAFGVKKKEEEEEISVKANVLDVMDRVDED